MSRRRFLEVGLDSLPLVATAAACGSDAKRDGPSSAMTKDFSARFERYEVADEPNGDIATVVWPGFVTEPGPEVKRLYKFQVVNGDLVRDMPCFGGCGLDDSYRNNRDCFIKRVNSMAPNREICLGVALDAMGMLDEGRKTAPDPCRDRQRAHTRHRPRDTNPAACLRSAGPLPSRPPLKSKASSALRDRCVTIEVD